VAGDGRLRLFCALRLPAATLDALERWQQDAVGSTGAQVRLLPRPSLHVTLAFLGHRPAGELAGIVEAVRASASEAEPPTLSVRRYRETRSVGMLVLDEAAGREHAAALADALQGRLERLGVYKRERRPWLPHVTVARFRSPPRLRPELPDLGGFSPSEAAVYHSVLRSGGAQYEVLESFALGGNH
jgi:2'-5' RNA ligase